MNMLRKHIFITDTFLNRPSQIVITSHMTSFFVKTYKKGKGWLGVDCFYMVNSVITANHNASTHDGLLEMYICCLIMAMVYINGV